MVYRAMIRSVLDYGCIAFDCASAKQKEKLDVVQTKALAICCGSMIGTACAALQVDCGEMPLGIRRRQLMMEYVAKTETIPDHPTRCVARKARLRGTQPGQEMITVKVRRVHEKVARPPLEPVEHCSHPPWRLQAPVVDTGLQGQTGITADHLVKYADRPQLFTSGSRTPEGKASYAFYVPSADFQESGRLTDNTSVFAAELMAIVRAINWCVSEKCPGPVILTSCLSAVQSVGERESKARPRLLNRLLEGYDAHRLLCPASPATLVWIPGHSGLSGREQAVLLSREAAGRSDVDQELSLEFGDVRLMYRDHFLREWQELWTKSITGSHYREIEPYVGLEPKFTDRIRRKERVITRLRFGHCRLNACLAKIKRHDTGKCDACDVSETVTHYLMECPKQLALQTQLLDECTRGGTRWTLRSILSGSRHVEMIYTWLVEQNQML